MQVNIKIDDKIYNKLKERAKENYRTITGELNNLLKEMLLDSDNSSTPQPAPEEKPKRKRMIIGDIEEEEDVKIW